MWPLRTRRSSMRSSQSLMKERPSKHARTLISAGSRSRRISTLSRSATRKLARLCCHWARSNGDFSTLASVRLSWDEAARQACVDNIGPLTSAARVAAGTHHDALEVTAEELAVAASSIYGGVHRCPCGGHYIRTQDGRIVCSVHGDANHPQPPVPDASNGGSLEMLNSFSEIRVLLTFLEDGLHAVLEIDRQ